MIPPLLILDGPIIIDSRFRSNAFGPTITGRQIPEWKTVHIVFEPSPGIFADATPSSSRRHVTRHLTSRWTPSEWRLRYITRGCPDKLRPQSASIDGISVLLNFSGPGNPSVFAASSPTLTPCATLIPKSRHRTRQSACCERRSRYIKRGRAIKTTTRTPARCRHRLILYQRKM